MHSIPGLYLLCIVTFLGAAAHARASSQCPSVDPDDLNKHLMVIESMENTMDKDGPRVELIEVAGSESGAIAALGLKFNAGTSSPIDYDRVTFRYGRLGFDITKRVAACFSFQDRIVVSSSMLDQGSHRLTVSLYDHSNKQAELKLRVKVI